MPAGNPHSSPACFTWGQGVPRCALDMWHFQEATEERLSLGTEKGKNKGLLSGEFREFTQGQECLTLQSYKCGVSMLLPARDLEHRPWANPSQEFVNQVGSRSTLKRQVHWTWEECVCCFSIKDNACDCPTANKPRGFTISSFGLGLAASLTDRCCLASQACATL